MSRLSIIVLFLFMLVGCSSGGESTMSPEPEPIPSLSSINPESGKKDVEVTINGNNFGTDINKVKVFFNNKEAAVQSVNNSQIKVLVPVAAGTGEVKIMVNNNTLTGSEFTYVLTIEGSTLAGSTFGFADGSGTSARFNLPRGTAVDTQGNIYVADRENNKIRKITPEGTVSTLAGSTQGFADGMGANAKFFLPAGVAVDASGNVYVADIGNHKIRKITPGGEVSTLAGSTQGFADGLGANAKFHFPPGVAVDASGNVYVADVENHKIRKITPGGEVTTLAGSTQGFADDTGTNAQFNNPTGLSVDASGNIYVADVFNHKIRKITPSGQVSTLAGSSQGFVDATGENALFNNPTDVTVDTAGNIYVADRDNHKIRKIMPNGEVTTLAGSTQGFADGSGEEMQFSRPRGLSVDAAGIIYVADLDNHKIRKITQE